MEILSSDGRFQLKLTRSNLGLIKLNIFNLKYAAAPRGMILTYGQARQLKDELERLLENV